MRKPQQTPTVRTILSTTEHPPMNADQYPLNMAYTSTVLFPLYSR